MIKRQTRLAKKFFLKLSIASLDRLVSKRQRFILAVIILSVALFIAEHFLAKSGVFLVFIIALLTDLFLFLSIKDDLEDNFSWQIFILPFLYTLAFGLFYLLVPARYLTRIIMTSLYALGLYSLFLSQNIFTVSSIRTIALVSGARTVSFALSLLSYLFLTNVMFSLHLNVFLTMVLIFVYTFPMVLQAIWLYTLDKSLRSNLSWVFFLSVCLLEVAILLWFWPSTPTVLAFFLTGVFYIVVGLSHMWIEKRLFRNVILEYLWVAFVMFVALILFTFLS